jgi:hypothetical protein
MRTMLDSIIYHASSYLGLDRIPLPDLNRLLVYMHAPLVIYGVPNGV